jgi:Excinuclease ABC subunit B
MQKFKLKSSLKPSGDQSRAISQISKLILNEQENITLLGVTGSGKTFTLANVIEKINIPTIVISHNKTLAAQLYSEFKEFFPENAVEYFVSYYDYYQPEAYIPQTDTYIEKDASINDRLDRLRLSATTSLMSRNDCLIVASVSCIYNLGSPEDYQECFVSLKKKMLYERDDLIRDLLNIQYERNDYEFVRGKVRVRGDTLEVFPAYQENAIRVEFLGDEISKISQINPLTGKVIAELEKAAIYPAKHFLVSQDRIKEASVSISQELQNQAQKIKKPGQAFGGAAPGEPH